MEEMELYRRNMIRDELQQILLILLPKPKQRRMWKRKRSTEWWDVVVQNFDDEEWLENFRVRKGTFDFICDHVRGVLAPHPRPVIKQFHGLSVEKIVAIALYKLAHVAEYKVIGNQFGVHKSTVHNCVYAFCYAITQTLEEKIIRMPDESEAQNIANNFEKITHIPQIIGAIDGSHIPITPPLEGNADFKNRKSYFSLILQAIVDDQYLFRNVSCRVPGACHDADALRESSFYKNRETMMPKGTRLVDNMEIPFFLIGDPAYPLSHWLLKNYEYNANISPAMDSFNVYLNSGRIVVENAFGRLKGRWRILLKRTEIHYSFVPTLVAACCILHNICEMSKEGFSNHWLKAVEDAEEQYPQPDNEPYDEENLAEGADIRDHLMLYLSRNVELRQSIRGRYAVM